MVAKRFEALTSKELSLVLAWRNDERVARWMHSDSPITPQEHANFVTSLVGDVHRRYWLLFWDDLPQAVVYLTAIKGGEAHIGIYVNPFGLSKGRGSKALLWLIDEAKRHNIDTLLLEVQSHNEAAKRLYAKSGFVKESEEGGIERWRFSSKSEA